jgi:hypothetical protein
MKRRVGQLGARIVVAVSLVAMARYLPRVAADSELPQVQLLAEHIAPRPIEDRTRTVIPRDYAYAWQTMAEALEHNRETLLDGYFTGMAKANLSQRIADQERTGIRVRYVDHGHRLEAVFYAPAGDAMQLRDQARFDVEILHGDTVIYRETRTEHYLVLMTPGADRWLVRDLESIPEA